MDVPNSINAPMVDYASPPVAKALDPWAMPLSDWVLSMADRHRRKLFAALVVIYLLGFNAQWRIEPDSALYLTVGRNLANGQGYTYNGRPQELVFPGLPLLFAGIFKLFHTQSLLPALIVMMLIGAATLGLTYRLFLLHCGRPTAVLITFGLGISRLFYRYNFELLSDMPFLLAVMAFMVGYEAIFFRGRLEKRARWFDWVLLIGGLLIAISMRPSMYALLIAIVLASVWSSIRGPYRLRHIIFCSAAIAAAIAFWILDPRRHGGHGSMGQYEDALFEATRTHADVMFRNLIHQNIPKMFKATLSQSLFGSRPGPVFSTLAGIAVVIVSATMLLKRPLWLLWVAVTFAMMLLVIEPLDRYFLEVLPLLVFAWWRGIQWLNHRLPTLWDQLQPHLNRRWPGVTWSKYRISQRGANVLFMTLFILGGVTNLMRAGEFIVEQRRVPFLSSYKEGRYASQEQVAKLIHDQTNEGSWVLTTPRFARILTFLSHRKVVGPLAQVELDPQGHQLFVLEPADDSVRKRLDQIGAVIGAQVGQSVRSPYDPQPWQLHQAEPQ
jgi:hypothetical protein